MNIIERAFEIAPECGSLDEVKRRLAREGYFNVNAHFEGRQIKSEILARLDPAMVASTREKRVDRRSEG
jgi:hypothetical protein